MEMSKLFFVLTELLIFWGEINCDKSKRKCRLFVTDRSSPDYIMAKKSEPVKLTCGSRVTKKCTEKMITVSLYKDNILLGKLSEKSKTIEYNYKIKKITLSDNGAYTCIFHNSYGNLSTTINLQVSDGSKYSSRFLPDDTDQIKPDQLYLRQDMKNVVSVKHLGLGSSTQFECHFYSPQRQVSLQTYWIKHNDEMKYSIESSLKSNQKLNISRNDLCDDTDRINFTCIHTTLILNYIDISDQGYFTCLIEDMNGTMRKMHTTFKLVVDATHNYDRNDKYKSKSSDFEFNSNSSVCAGQNFTLICAAEQSNLVMYLYKVHPNADLSKTTLNLNSSVLLKVQFPDAVDVTSLNDKDRLLISNNFDSSLINYTLISVSVNETGRYLCISVDIYTQTDMWKSMYLSLADCSFLGIKGNYLSTTIQYTFCVISIFLTVLLMFCCSILIRCKHRNDLIKRFPIRKIIIIEYESPIYKGMLNGAKKSKTNQLHSPGHLLPHSNPIIAPIVKIRAIKGSLAHPSRRSCGRLLPSTSTDRTRLESTQLSSQSDNEVFETTKSNSSLNLKSEHHGSSSLLIDSLYEFPRDHQWEFPREKLKITSHKLGEGAFGMVFEGLAKDINDGCGVTRVGVKMMKDDFSDSNVFDFVKEIETMKQIGRHRHVIQLLGVCTQNGPLRVIVELAPHGNLRDYIRSKSFKSSTSVKYSTTLSRSMLCMYALQIARGMTYLSSRSIVHRDLSARNILVGENYDMKIADFGLTRIVDYYYRKKTDGILPIKWMAPEALLEKKYTTKSDVWSYGILLWEIFSLGESPYASILPENVISIIKEGLQNPQPCMASMEMYRLMQQCWHLYSEHRPHFYQIVEILKDMSHRVCDEPIQNIYHSETLYLDMESEYLEPRESLP